MTGSSATFAGVVRVDLADGERWWGGAVADGQAMPFGMAPVHRDLAVNAGFRHDPTKGANQSAPLLLSDRGQYVWSDDPFEFSFEAGRLTLSGGIFDIGQAENTSLAGAFRAAAVAHFPASGSTPARQLFTGPQYNTWMEAPYAPTQRAVLDYVRGILDAGLPPGPVMIDDRWSLDYGAWRFDRSAFPDPASMVSTLHDWGCPVMLWLVPFVSPDSPEFRRLAARDLLVRGAEGKVAIREWWNGFSAILDVTNPDGVAWLHGELDALVDQFGIDGFKFDAGDLRHYRIGDRTAVPTDPAGNCEAWARVGLRYPFNEYRACWKMGGTPLAQRLHDKPGTWAALGSLIPESIAQGLIGHPFSCPDMVGGGDLAATATSGVDQEFFVRYAQCAALQPMMQFSMAPHRVLDAEHLQIIRETVELRQQLLPELLRMVDAAAATGEPILRSVVYDFPDEPAATDQFTLAGEILVAPVLQPSATRRTVRFPPGTWAAPDGTDYAGPAEVDLPVGLHTLPWFRRR